MKHKWLSTYSFEVREARCELGHEMERKKTRGRKTRSGWRVRRRWWWGKRKRKRIMMIRDVMEERDNINKIIRREKEWYRKAKKMPWGEKEFLGSWFRIPPPVYLLVCDILYALWREVPRVELTALTDIDVSTSYSPWTRQNTNPAVKN
jgi:hypothetical protein